ncbi:pectin lyase-like protein [Piromyces finnis]|uniref:Pectin lyase-like protein n=1 Tax=Piromyces finnis TaxID=1754191 RepID=A0A1Y1UYS9_9FUNG|nr:pectin lyase-like protein [Piromyces finnis]|eukprot:ORX43647.1 pectin lyase-like protein [Piromyces finnis]
MKSLYFLTALLQIVAIYAQNNCNPKFYQCGGQTWKGSNCCNPGLQCVKINDYYSTCLPSSSSSNTSSNYNNNNYNTNYGNNNISNASNVQNASSNSGPIGYASLNGGTTGGQGGQTYTVSNQSQLESAVKKNEAKIIIINGIIKLTNDITLNSNTSLIGANKNSGITGAGLHFKNVKNIIIQNLKFSYCVGNNKDCINAQKSTNIWIDHCEFFNDRNHGKDYYDGLVDITHACDYVTMSWCSLHDHYKVSLIGHSEKNAAEDTGKLHITYHHNYFKNVGSRLPSLRFGTGHVYNNVYENVESSCVSIRMSAQALVENNVYRNAKRPISTNLDTPEEGYVIQRNNDFGNTANTNSITKIGSLNTVPYKYTADNTNSVYDIIRNKAGPQ